MSPALWQTRRGVGVSLALGEQKVPDTFCSAFARRGFTLVELLVTVTVMAILMAVVLGGMRMANESARTARTRSTIAKINEVIM